MTCATMEAAAVSLEWYDPAAVERTVEKVAVIDAELAGSQAVAPMLPATAMKLEGDAVAEAETDVSATVSSTSEDVESAEDASFVADSDRESPASFSERQREPELTQEEEGQDSIVAEAGVRSSDLAKSPVQQEAAPLPAAALESVSVSELGVVKVEWGGVVYNVPQHAIQSALAPSEEKSSGSTHEAVATPVRDTGRSSASSDMSSTGPGRALAPLEAARSVEEAIRAKEKLAEQCVESAAARIAQRRQQLEEQQRLELAKLREEELKLQRMQQEVNSCPAASAPELESLRQKIEGIGREMHVAVRDVDVKRDRMRKATDLYVAAEEHVTELRGRKQRAEEEMLNMLLEIGKQRDERLNTVLSSI